MVINVLFLIGIEDIKQPILQLQFAAMLFMNVAFFNRPCDLTYYGPFVYDIELPTNVVEWDNDNLPQYIQIAFCESKGDLEVDRFVTVSLSVFARYLSTMFFLKYVFITLPLQLDLIKSLCLFDLFPFSRFLSYSSSTIVY